MTGVAAVRKTKGQAQVTPLTCAKMTASVDHIGRYQILEEIGRGAMGVVYRAQDPAIGRVAGGSLPDLAKGEHL